MRVGRAFALAVLATVACKKDPPAERPADSSASAPDATVVVVDAATDASLGAGEEKPPLTAKEKQALTSYGEAMGEGRAATRAKRYADAEEAFGKALSMRPGDARALSERGYARLLDGALEKADEDLQAALRGGVEPTLTAQVFFNLGLLREKRNEAESARAAFAISNALSPTAAAKGKLGGKSGCTADVQTSGKDEPLEHAGSVDELRSKIAPVKDLGSPMASICVRVNNALGDASEVDVCRGAPPWEVRHHYDHYTVKSYLVVPQKGAKKDEGFFFFATYIGGWPAHCTNYPRISGSMAGDFLEVTEMFDGSGAAIDDARLSPNGPEMACMDVLGYEAHSFYDTATGRRVARIYSPVGVPGPKVSTNGAKLVLEGGGCDRTIDLGTLRR